MTHLEKKNEKNPALDLWREIMDAAFAAFPGAMQQEAACPYLWEDGRCADIPADYPKIGRACQAIAKFRRDWAAAVPALAEHPAYAEARARWPKTDIIRMLNIHQLTGDELIKRLQAEADHVVHKRDGMPGSLSDLARLFPDYIERRTDEWDSRVEYHPRSKIGTLAIANVEAGMRARAAIDKARADEAARLEAEGKTAAEAVAITRNDREKIKLLAERGEMESNAIWKLSRQIPDPDRSRSPKYRRSSACRRADAAVGAEVLAEIKKLPASTGNVIRQKNRVMAEIEIYIRERQAAAARAENFERLYEIYLRPGDVDAEILRALLNTQMLFNSEKNSINEALAQQQEKAPIKTQNEALAQQQEKAPIKTQNDTPSITSGVWSALDDLKITSKARKYIPPIGNR